ncbi:alpha-pore-forming cytotoxin MakA [Pseudomonas floridensis]|uniref:alpha-pore-forming cytotoxin MakA n=2 Tax=Pseudomonas floridensis TaxID=1958950 RepID=UPI0012FF8507|nr:non-hemolytic enterotoxin lytic component L1 [Pseudomonas floridensis]
MMNVALTDTPNDLTPAPDNLFGNTGVSYNAAQLITIACHAVANTVFIAPTPKPAWFDDLNAELLVAQTLAATWINSLGTQVTKTIPLQVINFGSSFTAANNAIQGIVAANPTAQGADNPAVIEIKTIIQQALLAPIGTVINEMGLVSTQLTSWGQSMQTAHNNLVNGSTSIQAAETSLTTDISKMNDAISSLNEEIAGENKAIAASAAAIAVGVFALVVGVALAPETGGTSLLIGGAIGAAGIIGGAVTWGIMQSRINAQFDQIGHDQQELDDDQRQLVALQGLQLASNNAVSSIELATQSLSKLQTQWGTFQGELQGVLNQLESAQTQLSTIMEGVFTSAAQTEWATAITTANNLVNSPVQVQSQTLPIPS